VAKSTRSQRQQSKSDFRSGDGGNLTARTADLQTDAWTSFCQALFGAAEFRYLK
jgi:hypothetical protein